MFYRIVNWGASIGITRIPYLKAIGIRIHHLKYQRRLRPSKSKGTNSNSKATKDSNEIKGD